MGNNSITTLLWVEVSFWHMRSRSRRCCLSSWLDFAKQTNHGYDTDANDSAWDGCRFEAAGWLLALVVGNCRTLGHTELTAMLCLSDHKTTVCQCASPNAQSNLHWISYKSCFLFLIINLAMSSSLSVWNLLLLLLSAAFCCMMSFFRYRHIHIYIFFYHWTVDVFAVCQPFPWLIA